MTQVDFKPVGGSLWSGFHGIILASICLGQIAKFAGFAHIGVLNMYIIVLRTIPGIGEEVQSSLPTLVIV